MANPDRSLVIAAFSLSAALMLAACVASELPGDESGTGGTSSSGAGGTTGIAGTGSPGTLLRGHGPERRHVSLLVEPIGNGREPAVDHLVEWKRGMPHHLRFQPRVQRDLEQLGRFLGSRRSEPRLQQDLRPVRNDGG